MDQLIFNELTELFKTYLKSDGVELTENTKLRADLGMDSFAIMCLLGDIRDKFSVRIRYEDAGKFATLDDVVAFLRDAGR